MSIIFDDIIVNYDNCVSVSLDDESLVFDLGEYIIRVYDTPLDTLSKIAVAIATGKQYIELPGTGLKVEE